MKLFTGIMLSFSMVCYLIALKMAFMAYAKADAGVAGLNESINAVLFNAAGVLLMGLTILVGFLVKIKPGTRLLVAWIMITAVVLAFTAVFLVTG